MRVLVERHRRVRVRPGVRPRPLTSWEYLERVRLGLWDAFRLGAALYIKRRAFRVIQWTQRIEARAYDGARIEWKDC